jgi:type II secretory pathway pseudopilin PulG
MCLLQKKHRAGFTMIGLLVLLALILFLLGMILPFLFGIRRSAANAQSMNNLRQLGIAAHNFHDVTKQFPPTVGPLPGQPASKGTLFFYLLPYIEQNNIYQQAEGNVWKNGTYRTVIPTFLNPKDRSAPPENRFKGWLATTSYAANWMVFKLGGTGLRNITDGTSNTIMISERYQVCGDTPCAWGYSSLYPWAPLFAYYSKAKFQANPSQDDCDPALAQATDPTGIQVVLCDGSAHLVGNRISPQTWSYACDPADGNPLADDWLN